MANYLHEQGLNQAEAEQRCSTHLHSEGVSYPGPGGAVVIKFTQS